MEAQTGEREAIYQSERFQRAASRWPAPFHPDFPWAGPHPALLGRICISAMIWKNEETCCVHKCGRREVTTTYRLGSLYASHRIAPIGIIVEFFRGRKVSSHLLSHITSGLLHPEGDRGAWWQVLQSQSPLSPGGWHYDPLLQAPTMLLSHHRHEPACLGAPTVPCPWRSQNRWNTRIKKKD